MLRNYIKKVIFQPRITAQNQGTVYPTDLSRVYRFPAGDGTGQRIGIIELGGGYRLPDIQTYFTHLGIRTAPKITSVSVGAINNPLDTTGANYEVSLDIQIITSIVPGASVHVYFAPNTFDGFYNAINTAISQGCKIISISWGAPEDQWNDADLNRFNVLFQQAVESGCTITAATNNDSDRVYADFPASSPWVLACGGTSLASNREVVWGDNNTECVSIKFAVPEYQSGLGLLKRSVPDVSGNADPETGYKIFIEGKYYIIGGTSAVSPLWAALTALLSQHLGRSPAFLNSRIYAAYRQGTRVCRDILRENNGEYIATFGWDRCVGYGSPDGAALLMYLQQPQIQLTAKYNTQTIRAKFPPMYRFMDDSIGTPIKWQWSFGDGAISSEKNPIHTYNKIGAYTITLTIRDALNNTSTASSFINVTK